MTNPSTVSPAAASPTALLDLLRHLGFHRFEVLKTWVLYRNRVERTVVWRDKITTRVRGRPGG
ncbi:hypothetical protein ACFVW5_40460, partial [Streptomyces sp. NPDC058232]|uniref:hypothetical protein n=1 Tax=Streptomyces sp. NPDC058232 TaxID=3346393 RepID=UPI0036F10CBF